MTLVETYLPFGIRDVKITPFIGELGVGTPVDLPVGRVVTFRETESIELLKSDDRNVAMEGTGAMVEWEIEAGGISFEAWQVLTGASLVSGAGFRELIKLDTDVRPYFVIEGQSINDDGSDLHIVIRRCKVNGSIEGSFSEGTFLLTKCEGLGIGDSTGELWRMRWNTNTTDVFGGIRALPNTIQFQARPLTISVGNVVGASLTPALTQLVANKLLVSVGVEQVIALQPKVVNMRAQPLTITGGVGALTLAPKSFAMTAVPLLPSRGINLAPATAAMTARPLLVGSTSTIVEAESGTVEGGAVISTQYAGYTGTGYIGTFGLTGDVNQINFSAAVGGSYTFSIRYAQGNPAEGTVTVNIRVNGAIAGTVSLPNTSSDWTSPARFAQSSAITIPLTLGNNVIRIEHSGLEYTYSDLDSYTFTGAGGGGTGGVAPVAEFTMNPSSGVVGQTIQFNDSSTNFPTSWAWLFGDGATSTQQNPTHSFAGASTYNVQLTATNATGSNAKTHSIVIGAGGGTGGTPDYVVGVNGSLQQILELPYSSIAGKRVLVPSGTWNGPTGAGILFYNKDFGNVIVEFQSGGILRGPGGSGVEFYGGCRNLTLVGPGKIQALGNSTNAEGIYQDASRTNNGSPTNGLPGGNITVDGLTVEPIPGSGVIGRNGVAFWSCDKIIIRNCTIHDASGNAAYGFGGAGSGISIGQGWRWDSNGGERVLIENNHVYNQLASDGNPSADRNGIILDLYHSVGNFGDFSTIYGNHIIGSVMIRNNNIHDVSGRGIQILFAGLPDSPIYVDNNTISGQWARYLGPEPGSGNFSDPQTGIGGNGRGVHSNVVVTNNTVVDDPAQVHPSFFFFDFNTSPGVTGSNNHLVGGGFVDWHNSPGTSPPAGFIT
ncbi:MAG: hypothetical protein DMF62_04880 [Acidobacteria bacterium]|nr:MAG: hypothetical protein DMF62_04880 [Acidobacteriota bacterium]